MPGGSDLDVNEGMLPLEGKEENGTYLPTDVAGVEARILSPTSTTTSAFDVKLVTHEQQLLSQLTFTPESSFELLFRSVASRGYLLKHEEILSLALQLDSHNYHALAVEYLDKHEIKPNAELQHQMVSLLKLELSFLKPCGNNYILLDKSFRVFAGWIKTLDTSDKTSLIDQLLLVVGDVFHENSLTEVNGVWVLKKLFNLLQSNEIDITEPQFIQILSFTEKHKDNIEILSASFELFKKAYHLDGFDDALINILASIQALPQNFNSFLESYLANTDFVASEELIAQVVTTIVALLEDEVKFDLLSSLNLICKYGQLSHLAQKELLEIVPSLSEFIADDMHEINSRIEAAEFIMWLYARFIKIDSSLDTDDSLLLQNSFDEIPISWKIEISSVANAKILTDLLALEIIEEDEVQDIELDKTKAGKTLDELYTEIQFLNPSLESTERIEKIKLVFAEFTALKDKLMAFADNKPIAECSADELNLIVSDYRKSNYCADAGSIPELLALINRAVYLDNGFEARDIQIIAVIDFLLSDGKGRLLQIATGEGKSTISAMLAAAKVLQGEVVDIVTSSAILAERDAKEKKAFYSIFGISVDHNCTKQEDGFKSCYSADVVYGDASNFQYDYLRHEYELRGTRGERGFGVVIADEVDSMLIDEGSKIAMVSSGVPGSEYLELAMIALWNRLNLLNQHLKTVDGNTIFSSRLGENQGGVSKSTEDTLPEDDEIIIEDVIAFKKLQLKNYLDELVSLGNIIPGYMAEFVALQKAAWIESVLKAEVMEEGKNYILLEKGRKKIIAPVDFQNTGITQGNTCWSGGLHQFLQIKHCLKIVPENLVAKFISNMEYFTKYGSKLYGMTGTLGSEDSKAFLKEQYNVDLGHIPTFRAKTFTETEGAITETDEDWINAIVGSVEQCTQDKRAVLVIASTIKEAEAIAASLNANGFPQNKVRLYIRSDDNTSSVTERVVSSGEVIIATNLAGRGTDIKTSFEVEQHGGLHVCVTFLPSNLRVEEQAFGRTSRQGNLGTAELIVNIKSLPDVYQEYIALTSEAVTITNLKDIRNQIEHDRLERVSNYEAANLKLKDSLFKKFCEFTKPWRVNKQYQYKLAQVEEKWGLFLQRLDNKDELINAREAEEGFQKFRAHIANTINNNSSFFTNPAYLVKTAINELGKGNSYLASISLFGEAAALEPGTVFAAHYYKAYAIFRDADVRYAKDAKKISSSYLNEAANELVSALNVIDGQLIPNLEGMQMLLPQTGDNELLTQLKNKIEILEAHKKNIHILLNKIKACDPEDGRLVISERQLLKDKLSVGIEADEAEKYEDEIKDFNSVGLFYLYDVVEVEYPTDIVSAIAMAVLGVMQIAVGVIFAATLHVGFVVSFFMSGIGDVFKSMKIFNGEEAKWSSYFTEKAIEVAVTLICVGVEKIMDAAKAAKAAKTANTSVQGAKASTAVGISEGAIKTEVAKAGLGTAVITEAEKKIIAKETISEAIKQVVIKTAVNHVVDYVSDLGIEELLRNFKADIKQEAHSKVNKLLRESVIEDALFRIAAAEEYTKYKYSDVIYNYIYTIFTSKQHLLMRIGSGVLSKLSSASNAHMAFKVADKGLIVANIAMAIQETSEVLAEVSDSVRAKIIETAAKPDTIEQLICKHLTRYGEDHPEEKSKEICDILIKRGIIVGSRVVKFPSFGIGEMAYDSREWQIVSPLLKKLNDADEAVVSKQKLEQSKIEIEERYSSYACQMIYSKITNNILKPATNPILSQIATPLVEGVINAAKAFHQDHLLQKTVRNTQAQSLGNYAANIPNTIDGVNLEDAAFEIMAQHGMLNVAASGDEAVIGAKVITEKQLKMVFLELAEKYGPRVALFAVQKIAPRCAPYAGQILLVKDLYDSVKYITSASGRAEAYAAFDEIVSATGIIFEKSKVKASQVELQAKEATAKASSGGAPDPDDEEKERQDASTQNDKIFDPKKDGNHGKIWRSERFGKLYQDAKNKKIWYSKERSGDRAHAGEHWKKFKEYNNELIHQADIDLTGKIIEKPKSLVGTKIKIKDLIK